MSEYTDLLFKPTDDFVALDRDFSLFKSLFDEHGIMDHSEVINIKKKEKIRPELIKLCDEVWSKPLTIHKNKKGIFNLITLLYQSSLYFLIIDIITPGDSHNKQYLLSVAEILWWLLYSDHRIVNVISEFMSLLDEINSQDDQTRSLDIGSIFTRITDIKPPLDHLGINKKLIDIEYSKLFIVCINSSNPYIGPLSYVSAFKNMLGQGVKYFVYSQNNITQMCETIQSPPVCCQEYIYFNLKQYDIDGVIDANLSIKKYSLSMFPNYFLDRDNFEDKLRILPDYDIIVLFHNILSEPDPLRNNNIKKILKEMSEIESPDWIRNSDYCTNRYLNNPFEDVPFGDPNNLSYGVPGNHRCYSFSDLYQSLADDGSYFIVPDYLDPIHRDEDYPQPFGLDPKYELGYNFNLDQAMQLKKLIVSENIRVTPHSVSPTKVKSNKLISMRIKDPFLTKLELYIKFVKEKKYSVKTLYNKYMSLSPEDAVLVSNYFMTLYRLAYKLRTEGNDQNKLRIELEFLNILERDMSNIGLTFIKSLPTWTCHDQILEDKIYDIFNNCMQGKYCILGASDVLYCTSKILLIDFLKEKDMDQILDQWQIFTFSEIIKLPSLEQNITSTGHVLI